MGLSTKRNTTPSLPKSIKRTNKLAQKAGKTIIRKKKPFNRHKEVYNTDENFYLWRMEALKAGGYFRKNMFGCEVIWNKTKYHFSTPKNRESFKDVFIFAAVKRDAMAYYAKHTIKPAKQLPPIVKNPNIKVGHRQVQLADLDDAYWTIACKMGIITKKTFERGLLIRKGLCNAALASLGADKAWFIITKGELTHDKIINVGDPRLKLVYSKIRNRCFEHMRNLAKLLGKDFVRYKTDCIYYIKNKKNMALVDEYMAKNKFYYKQAAKPRKRKKSNSEK